MTSPDGITWTIRTSAADNAWRAIAWNGTVFAAVSLTGTNNRVMTSSDGINWAIRVTPVIDCTAIAWNGTVFVAAGNGGGNRIMTSPDGITWTARDGGNNDVWRTVAWNGLGPAPMYLLPTPGAATAGAVFVVYGNARVMTNLFYKRDAT